jgi:hypothetical protein
MILDVETSRMNASPPVNHWNPDDILDSGNMSFRFGLLILNQPINVQKDLMISLWNRGKYVNWIFWFNLVQNVLFTSLFNNAISSSNCMALDDYVIKE